MDGEPRPDLALAPPGTDDGAHAGGRAEVDTSAPFRSVREAVDRFGGGGAWSNHRTKRMFALPQEEGSEEESTDLEEQTAQLEKELSIKERETLDVLTELGSAKKIIADLRLKIHNEATGSFAIADKTVQAAASIAEPEEKQPENAETSLKIQNEEVGAFSISEETGQAEAPNAEPEEKQPETYETGLKIQNEEVGTFSFSEATGQAKPQPENGETDVDMGGPDEQLQQQSHGSSVLKELGRAKANLNRTTSDLAAIRASVSSLRNDIAKERLLVETSREKLYSKTTFISSLEDKLGRTAQELWTLRDLQRTREDPSDIFIEIKKMTSELEQLRNEAKASRSEAMMLAAEISQTRASIGTAEVKCLAAKKIEEAARVAEALALTEIKVLLRKEASADLQGRDGVNLSVEEYSDLVARAQEADESLRKNIEAAMAQVDEANQLESGSLKKLEEAKLQVEECKKALQEALKRVDAANQGKLAIEEALLRCQSATGRKRRLLNGPPKFKNAAHRCIGSHNVDITHDLPKGTLNPTLSIGQILSMKLTGPDGYDKSIWDDTSETSSVSLGQILNRRRAVVYSSDTTGPKKLSGKRKKFSFTGLSVFLAKQAKNKKKKGSHEN